MIIREAPTEEEIRKMRAIRILDGICVGLAIVIMALTILQLVYDVEGDMLVFNLLLGAAMNLGLSIHAVSSHLKAAAAGALGLALVCLGMFIYLVVR